jgi:hypothetical protein
MRIVEQWIGGASISQSHYRVIINDDDTYEIQIQSKNRLENEPEYRALGKFEHLKAQQIAAHFILDDKERVERREIRDEFMRKLKRA